MLPLAQQNPEAFQSISRAFTEGQDLFNLRPLIIGAVTLAILLVGVRLIQLHRRRSQRWALPHERFNQLADLVGLKSRDRGLLMNIAEYASLPSPLTLLLSGDTFDHHADRYARSLAKPRQRWARARATSLHRYLFSDEG